MKFKFKTNKLSVVYDLILDSIVVKLPCQKLDSDNIKDLFLTQDIGVLYILLEIIKNKYGFHAGHIKIKAQTIILLNASCTKHIF